MSLKDIVKLVKPLREQNVPLDKIEKLIFMEKYYVWHAKNRVITYNNLARNEFLPENWDEIHNNFYKLMEKYEATSQSESTDSDEENLTLLLKNLSLNRK